MYAENNQIYNPTEDGNELERRLNQDIKMVSQWCKENNLKANKDKFQALAFQKKRKRNMNIKLLADENNEAQQTRCLKLLAG